MAETDEAQRVMETIRTAAADALQAGRAELTVTTSREAYGDAEYDCPVVMLSPVNPKAARVLVEVQEKDAWWLLTGDGPGTEFYPGMERDRHEQLAALVRAVVAGRYTHGPVRQTTKGIFRIRALGGWGETFETEDGPFTSRHFGRAGPEQPREFDPY